MDPNKINKRMRPIRRPDTKEKHLEQAVVGLAVSCVHTLAATATALTGSAPNREPDSMDTTGCGTDIGIGAQGELEVSVEAKANGPAQFSALLRVITAGLAPWDARSEWLQRRLMRLLDRDPHNGQPHTWDECECPGLICEDGSINGSWTTQSRRPAPDQSAVHSLGVAQVLADRAFGGVAGDPQPVAASRRVFLHTKQHFGDPVQAIYGRTARLAGFRALRADALVATLPAALGNELAHAAVSAAYDDLVAVTFDLVALRLTAAWPTPLLNCVRAAQARASLQVSA